MTANTNAPNDASDGNEPAKRAKRYKGVAPNERQRVKPPTGPLAGDVPVTYEQAARNAALMADLAGAPQAGTATATAPEPKPTLNGATNGAPSYDYDQTEHDDPTDDEQPPDDEPPTNRPAGWRDYKADALALTKAVNYLRLAVTAKTQPAKWQMRCPDRKHADEHASAFISGEGGRLGWGCARGCHETHGGGGLEGLVRCAMGLPDGDAALAWLRANWPLGRPEPRSTRPADRKPAPAARRRPRAPYHYDRADGGKRTPADAHARYDELTSPPFTTDERVAAELAAADERVAEMAVSCGLTADQARAYGLAAGWQPTDNYDVLELWLAARTWPTDEHADGLIYSWGRRLADGEKRSAPKCHQPQFGRDRFARDGRPAEVVLVAEGQRDYLAACGLLDEAGRAPDGRRWSVLGVTGLAATRMADELADHCELKGWALPSLVVVMDGDDDPKKGDDEAASAVATYRLRGGQACALRLPDGCDVRDLATDARRDALLAALVATARAADDGETAHPFSDDEASRAAALGGEADRQAEAEGNPVTANAAMLTNATIKGRAAAFAAKKLMEWGWRYVPLAGGGYWCEWQNDRQQSRSEEAALRAAAEALTRFETQGLRPGAATLPKSVKLAAVDQAKDPGVCGPSSAVVAARDADGRTPPVWSWATGEPIDGWLVGGHLVRFVRPADAATAADLMVVTKATRDMMGGLPAINADVSDLMARAKRVRKTNTYDDLAALRADTCLPARAGWADWLTLLEMPNDQQGYLEAKLGGTALAAPGKRKVLVIWGDSGSGKSEMTALLRRFVGDAWAGVKSVKYLSKQFALGILRTGSPKRLLFVPDLPPKRKRRRPTEEEVDGLSLLKTMSGGDPLLVEGKGKELENLELALRYLLVGQDLPDLSAGDLTMADAFKRRTAMVRFGRSLTDAAENGELGETELADEEGAAARAMFETQGDLVFCQWLVAYAVDAAGWLTRPDACRAMVEQATTDDLESPAMAVRELVAKRVGGEFALPDLVRAAQGWGDDHLLTDGDRDLLTAQRLGVELKSFVKRRRKGIYYYEGGELNALALAYLNGEGGATGEPTGGYRLVDDPPADAMLGALADDTPPPPEPTDAATSERPPMSDAELDALPADSWLRDDGDG